jgi:hypothetical protein
MDIDKVYDAVEEAKDASTQRQLIINYCMSFVSLLESDPEARQDIAYNIATFESTEYAESLEEEDPLSVMLNFAGVMEDAEPDSEDWALFIEIIQSLE